MSRSIADNPPITSSKLNPFASQIDEWIQDDSVRSALKKAQTSCVFINHKHEDGEEQGSGVIIDASGIVLTASHCTGGVGSTRAVETIYGDKFNAVTVRVSSTHDLALLQIPPKHLPQSIPLTAVVLSSAPLKKNDWCMAIGQPYYKRKSARKGNQRLKAELGKITRVPVDPLYIEADQRGIVSHNCNTTAGHSGCPLFNMKGEICGLHVTCDDHEQTAVTLEAIKQFLTSKSTIICHT